MYLVKSRTRAYAKLHAKAIAQPAEGLKRGRLLAGRREGDHQLGVGTRAHSSRCAVRYCREWPEYIDAYRNEGCATTTVGPSVDLAR